MPSRKRELSIFLTILGLTAVLATLLLSSPKPPVLVLETRYHQPFKDSLWLRRGEQVLFRLPELYRLDGGGRAREVVESLGLPQEKAGFLEGELFLWRLPVRYDWDTSLEYQGSYLALGFSPWNGEVSSVALYKERPVNALACTAEEFEALLEKWDGDN